MKVLLIILRKRLLIESRPCNEKQTEEKETAEDAANQDTWTSWSPHFVLKHIINLVPT